MSDVFSVWYVESLDPLLPLNVMKYRLMLNNSMDTAKNNI